MKTHIDMETHQKVAQEQRAPSPWTLHLTALAVIILALGTTFFADIKAAVEVWWNYPAYSHCFLIIPISAWLTWERRVSLNSSRPACSPGALLCAVPFLFLWFIGEFASITEFRQFALIGLAESFLIAILGWHIFRMISFACLYLFFLVPTGQYLIPSLQEITAKFVESGLSIFGVPFFRDGLVFQLVNGGYEIAEACAGLRFLIATVALGVLFAHLVFRKKAKIVLFLLSCIVFPIIGNGIRALLTVTIANYTSNRVAAGFDHIVYGWMFAVAIIFTLFYIGSIYRDPEANTSAGSVRPPVGRPHYLALLATLAGAFVMLAIAPALAYLVGNKSQSIDPTALDRIVTAQGWHILDVRHDWQIDFFPGDAQVYATLARNGDTSVTPVDVDINYYHRERGSPSLLAAHNHAWLPIWHPIEQNNVHQELNGTYVPFNETIISAGNFKRLVWTTYWVDGQFTTSTLTLRLLEFHSAIARGHSSVLALSTPITTTTAVARKRLAALLVSFGNLSGGLSRAGSSTPSAR